MLNVVKHLIERFAICEFRSTFNVHHISGESNLAHDSSVRCLTERLL